MGFQQLCHAGNLDPGGDEPADNDVFLQSLEPILRAAHRCLSQHPGGFLEGSRRQEAVGQQRCPCNTEEDGLGGGRLSALGQHFGVLVLELEFVDHLAGYEVGVPGGFHLYPAEHLPEDDLDVFVVDRHTLALVDLLYLVNQVILQVVLAAYVKDIVRVQRSADQRVAGHHGVAVLDQHVR